MQSYDPRPLAAEERNRGCLGITLIVLLTVMVTAGCTFWLLKSQVFADRFEPTALDRDEQFALKQKLARVGLAEALTVGAETAADDLAPTPYTEAGANRRIALSEREVNALLASNSNMGEKLVLDFSDDLLSAKLLLPLDPDLPFLGGQTLRLNTGVELRYRDRRPSVVLKGISLWGVPIPSAWLGGLKNVDLVENFGDEGFWAQFAEGVDNIAVDEGALLLELRE